MASYDLKVKHNFSKRLVRHSNLLNFSSATGEPAVAMSIVAVTALRHALDSARDDSGLKADAEFYHLGAPSTSELIFLAANNQPEQFIFN